MYNRLTRAESALKGSDQMPLHNPDGLGIFMASPSPYYHYLRFMPVSHRMDTGNSGCLRSPDDGRKFARPCLDPDIPQYAGSSGLGL